MDTYLSEVVRYLAAQSWQIALLTITVAAATFALRHRSAHVRYLLWLIVVAKCLVPPLYVVPLGVLPAPPSGGIPGAPFEADWPAGRSGVSSPVSPEQTAVPVPASTPPAQTPRVDERRLSVSGWLGIIWGLGAGACVTMNLLRALRGQHWLRKSREPLPGEMLVDTTEMLRAYGIRRLPRIWMVEGVGQPFVWGLLRGNVYVPPSFVTIESPEHRRDVLAHELSHIVRFDAGVNCLQVMAQAIFWFHPLVWWANRRTRAEREKCCDEIAVARLGTPAKDYCSAVVETLANMKKSTRPVPSLAVAGPIRNIEERIKTMLRPGREFYQRPSLRAAVVVLLIALFTVPTSLVLSAKGGTRQVAAATEKPIANPAGKDVSQGSDAVTGGAVATARFGDLLRTFQDPNVKGNSWFGYSLATAGNNVLVGAPVNGTAYLFDGSTAKLLRAFVSPPTAKGRIFGWCVAAAGNKIVVADSGENTDGEKSGRVYLFNGSTGDLLHTFVNPKPAVYRNFGQAVAGMGGNRIVIGATCGDVRADGAGAVFLFDASTGKMLQVFQKPKRATTANPLHACITTLGEDVLVGATEDDTGAERAGSVYMFDGSTGKLVRTFQNPTPTVGDYFGNWIAAVGDNVLIGASDVCLFDRGTGRLLRTFPNPAPRRAGERSQGDVFGRCVAFVGNNVLIGVSGDDTGAENAGAAYLFEGTTGKVLHKFVNPNPVADAHFGVQVAALGNDILIAARPTRGDSPGTVYLFKGVD